MNREIKFRCYDTLQGGKYEYWDSKTNAYNGIFWAMIKNKSFKEPQQYTGLKDKNGKEIYEGDIIQSDYRKRIFKVVWRRNGWALEWNKSYDYSTLYNRSVMVIGNIYDNPDLLNSKTS